MKKLHWTDFEPHNPCGDYSHLPPLTMLEILEHPEIPDEHKLWAFMRHGITDNKILRLFACKCVRDTPLPDGRKHWDLLTDERSRKAVWVAEAYARGEATDEELAAAWAAARAAAWAAARAAAWAAARAANGAAGDAAWAAAGDAARAAAWAAAGDAAWAAANGAAWAAARAAAWAAQVQLAIELLKP